MGEVFRRNGRYFVKQSEKYPATPIGAHFIDTEKVYLEAVAGRLRRTKYENKLKMAYMKAININGSVFMEILALKAVKVLFGKSVVSDELTAGAQRQRNRRNRRGYRSARFPRKDTHSGENASEAQHQRNGKGAARICGSNAGSESG